MLIVIALGGNALLKRAEPLTIENQRANTKIAAKSIAEVINAGHKVIITHGNGPQVGLLALQGAAYKPEEAYPLDVLGAETEGMIGYLIQQELENALPLGHSKVAMLLTQIEVDPKDPAFDNPTKPVGPIYTKEEAENLASKRGWTVAVDGKNYRRVVASPEPILIPDITVIEILLKHNIIVICAGGGGIPIVRQEDGSSRGIEAVIDKDFGSALLAANIRADLFVISTAVEKVALYFNTPDQVFLDQMTVAKAKQYIEEGHFAAGSMLPKIQAIIKFFDEGGKKALITDPKHISDALDGKTGTWIVP